MTKLQYTIDDQCDMLLVLKCIVQCMTMDKNHFHLVFVKKSQFPILTISELE